MDFTGERFVPSLKGQIRFEHLHRYALSLEFVEGRSVLDIASGEGYGAAILASKAKSVIGVDTDSETVRAAGAAYNDPRLHFVVGDCGAVPTGDAVFEVVTSFETIEHHDKHEEMLGEIKRVLKPGGVLIISSPNRLTYSEASGQANPFHVKELDYDELVSLLGRHFTHVRVYGQRITAGSFVSPLTDSPKTAMGAWTGDAGDVSRQVCSEPAPVYYVAICSDNRRVAEREISSVYRERSHDLLRLLEDEKQDQIDGMQVHVRNTEKELARQKEGYSAEIQKMESEVVRQKEGYEAHVRKTEDQIVRQRDGYEAEISRQTDELVKARSAYEEQFGHQQSVLEQLQSNNLELTQSAREAHAHFTRLNEELAAKEDELVAKEDELAATRDELPAKQRVIARQKEAIALQAETISRQTEVLSWIYLSRGWQVARRFQQLEELRRYWVARLGALLGRPTGTAFLGAVECAKFLDRQGERLEIRGWAYSETSRIIAVEAFVDKRYLGRLRYGVARPDVAAPNSLLNCGYSQTVNLAGLDVWSKASLVIRVHDDEGNRHVFESPIPFELPEPQVASEPPDVQPVVEEGPPETRLAAGSAPSIPDPISPGLAGAIAEFRARAGRDPSIVDWDSGLHLASAFPGLAVCSPPLPAITVLPYLDQSIDIVATAAADSESLAEAHRVARTAILRAGTDLNSSEGGFELEWHADGPARRPLPTASIIIPVYNNASFTERCLDQLQRTLPRDFEGEIVVVDDASSDDTPGLLERWSRKDERIVVLRNSENAGFVGSCNRGAEKATAEILVFLNNDTLPRDGWLQPLLAALQDRPDAGVVCGKLLYPDGRLQEAGGVVFSDGSACNFGRNEPANAALFSFFREVDYCSGALLATRRKLFLELGGFDTRFAPGYYEDTDYCFSIREKGFRVYFQPESAIVHFEGVSAGTDAGSGMKRYQGVNRSKFLEKWREALKDQPPPPEQYDFATLHALSVRFPTKGHDEH